jgi:hypothetical protein
VDVEVKANRPTIKCICCDLLQPVRVDQYGIIAGDCARCTWHQGDSEAKQLARATCHEAMLRERLEACRASETEARHRLREARERVASALESRGRLAARLVEATSRDSHRCEARALANDPNVVRWARRYNDYIDRT